MKKRKKLFALLFSAAFAASALGAPVPAAAATVNLPDPRVSLANGTSLPDGIGVGSIFDLDLNFTHAFDVSGKSQNEIAAFNELEDAGDELYAEIDVSSETGSVSVGKSSYTIKAEITDEDEEETSSYRTVTYHLYLPQKELKRTGSSYGVLKFKVTYYDIDSNAKKKDKIENGTDGKSLPTFTVEYQVFPKLEGSTTQGDGRLSVESYRLDHSPVKEGEKFSLTMTVKNAGGIACMNARSVLDLSGADGVSIDGVTDTKELGTLAAGATASVTYPLVCLPKMTTGSYPVGVTLSADEADAASSKLYIPVTGTKTSEDDTGEAGESKPQIIIESYDFGGTAATGGQEFNLAMRIRNTGEIAIENCKMTVGSAADNDDSNTAGSIFTPAKSSNSFFIQKLGAGAAVDEEIALLPKADASPNSYGVVVNFSYDAVVDGKRQTLTAEETITIPLAQPDRFEVGEAVLSNPMFLGEGGQLSIDYVNKGKSQVYNVSVEIAGNFQTDEGSTYIGNLDSGTSDTFQAALTPTEEGSLTGTATFRYEDAAGKVTEIAKDFSCEVQAQEVPAMGPGGIPGKPGMEEPGGPAQGGPGWKLWVGIFVAAAVLAAATVIVLKKRKAKKLRLLEEADDYDDEPNGGNPK